MAWRAVLSEGLVRAGLGSPFPSSKKYQTVTKGQVGTWDEAFVGAVESRRGVLP
jgi:hypothetical protein